LGFSGEDGIALKYVGKTEFAKFSAVLGSYNNLAVSIQNTGALWFGTSPVVVGDNSFSTAPKSQSRVTQAIVMSDIPIGDGVIEGKILYGMQVAAVTKTITATNYNARDVSNTEFSLGYNYNNANLMGGIWYQSVMLGATQISTSGGVTNNFTYVNANLNDSQTINTIGLGMTGTSKLWGLSGLLEEGDSLSYGIAYQNSSGQLVKGGGGTTGVVAFSNQPLNDNIFNIALGYRQGKFDLELDYAYADANYAVYDGSDGIENKTSANILYLVATLFVI
jgi:hypothetical protein